MTQGGGGHLWCAVGRMMGKLINVKVHGKALRKKTPFPITLCAERVENTELAHSDTYVK